MIINVIITINLILGDYAFDGCPFALRFTYVYDIQPQSDYPDTLGIELSDQLVPPNLHTGNAAYNPPWVGFLIVNPTITLFFGSTASIKALRLYFQGNGVGGIYLPSSVIIGNSSYSITDTGRSGWYEFTGAWTNNTLTVKLNQNSRSSSSSTWIFLGELVVVASYNVSLFNASLSPTPTHTPTLNPTAMPSIGKNFIFCLLSMLSLPFSSMCYRQLHDW